MHCNRGRKEGRKWENAARGVSLAFVLLQTGACWRRRAPRRQKNNAVFAISLSPLSLSHLERVLLLRALVLDHVDAPRHAVPDHLHLLVVVPHAGVRPVVHEALAAEGGDGGERKEEEVREKRKRFRARAFFARAARNDATRVAGAPRPFPLPADELSPRPSATRAESCQKHAPHAPLLALAAWRCALVGDDLDGSGGGGGVGRPCASAVRGGQRAGDRGVRGPGARADGAHPSRAGPREGRGGARERDGRGGGERREEPEPVCGLWSGPPSARAVPGRQRQRTPARMAGEAPD